MHRLFSAPPHLRRLLLLLPEQKASAASFHRAIHADDSASQQSHLLLPTSPYGFVKLLSRTANLTSIQTVEQYHSAIVKLGLSSNVFVATSLLGQYSKCRNFTIMRKMFDETPRRNAVTWNTLIRGFLQSHQPKLAIEAFSDMLVEGIYPTHFTVSIILSSFSHWRDLVAGIILHCICFKLSLSSNVVVGTAMADMYCKCWDMDSAKKVFDEMSEINVVTWTCLITGYAHHRRPIDAMVMVREMKQLGILMSKMTYNSLLSSFRQFSHLVNGKQVHCTIIKEGLDFDPYIAVSLVTMYSKCGSSVDFINACPNVDEGDQVSLNSIVAGFSRLGDGREVLVKFAQMKKASLDVDIFTFASLLRAIGIVSELRQGRQAHALILKSGHKSNSSIQNGLVSMYAKCGEIDDSKAMFSSMNAPDLISWNSVLSGCAQHGYGEEAIELFEEMRGSGVMPDATTYLAVLSACGHAGMVKKGLEFFRQMREGDSPVTERTEHYACVVDLLSRAGYLDEAAIFVSGMPMKAGVSAYRALLGACRVHGNVEMAESAAKRLFELSPDDSGTRVLLSNVFASDGSWDVAAGIRVAMDGDRVMKKTGLSCLEGYATG